MLIGKKKIDQIPDLIKRIYVSVGEIEMKWILNVGGISKAKGGSIR